jgi:hypothetical protein
MLVGKTSAMAFAALLTSVEVSGIVWAQAEIAPSSTSRTISCETPVFAHDSNHARLTAFFGAENVEIRRMPSVDGDPPEVRSIVYPNDPKNRLQVTWSNDTKLEGISEINFEEPSAWVGPNGFRPGMTLAELERETNSLFSFVVIDAENSNWGPIFIGVYEINDKQPGNCSISVLLKPLKTLTLRQKKNITGIFKSISQPLRDAGMRSFAIAITYERALR